jgi:preprotein translocase SecE subunit
MARNRQRAKDRQARRKAQGGSADGQRPKPGAKDPPRAESSRNDPAPETKGRESGPDPEVREERAQPEARDNGREDEPVVDPHLLAGAPPEDVGRSDEVLGYEQDLDADDDKEHFDSAEDIPEEDLAPGSGGRRASAERHKHRPRLVQFLIAVSAELQRVQWPDRQALTTLTGVVLGFVMLAGGYLGLLDAIFSRIIQAIL